MVIISLCVVSILLAISLFVSAMLLAQLIRTKADLEHTIRYLDETLLTSSAMQSYMHERHKVFVPMHKDLLEKQIAVEKELDRHEKNKGGA